MCYFREGQSLVPLKIKMGKRKVGFLFCVTYQTLQIHTDKTKRKKVREPLINNRIFIFSFINCFMTDCLACGLKELKVVRNTKFDIQMSLFCPTISGTNNDIHDWIINWLSWLSMTELAIFVLQLIISD